MGMFTKEQRKAMAIKNLSALEKTLATPIEKRRKPNFGPYTDAELRAAISREKKEISTMGEYEMGFSFLPRLMTTVAAQAKAANPTIAANSTSDAEMIARIQRKISGFTAELSTPRVCKTVKIPFTKATRVNCNRESDDAIKGYIEKQKRELEKYKMKANTSMSGIHGEADFGNLQTIVEDSPFGGVDFTSTLGASYGFAEMGNVDYTPMSGIDMGIPEGLGAFDVVEHIKKNKNLIMAAVAIAAAYWYFRKRK